MQAAFNKKLRSLMGSLRKQDEIGYNVRQHEHQEK